jgi:hypothetical protein
MIDGNATPWDLEPATTSVLALKGPDIIAQGNALGFGNGDDIYIGPEGAGHNSPGQRPGSASCQYRQAL